LDQFAQQVRREVAIEPEGVYLTVGCHLYGQGVYERETKSGADIKARRMFKVKAGDLVVNRIWAQKGSAGIVPSTLNGAVVTQDFPVWQLDSEQALRGYIGWYLRTPAFWEECRRHSYGTSGRERLSTKEMPALAFPLPPVAEQHRIVARIDELAALIEEAQGLRAKAREASEALQDSVVREAFERGRASGWPVESVESLLAFGPQNGLFKTKEHYGRGTLLLNVADAYKGLNVSTDTLDRVDATQAEVDKYALQMGDVCIVRSSIKDTGIGRACVFVGADEPVVFECHLMRLRFDPKRIDPRLFTRFFNSATGKEQLLAVRRRSVMTTINQQDVNALVYPLAPLEDQRRLAEQLIALDGKVQEVRVQQAAAQSELDALLPSVLDRAFKGEL
jgi:type I restriction enzyme S subunit